MRFKNSLKICRLLVALLLFNMAVPLAAASLNDSNTFLICTSAGFIEVSLDDMSETSSTNVHASSAEHCAFCKITDIDTLIGINKPVYRVPESNLVLNYKSVSPPSPQKLLIKHALMRAPPTINL